MTASPEEEMISGAGGTMQEAKCVRACLEEAIKQEAI